MISDEQRRALFTMLCAAETRERELRAAAAVASDINGVRYMVRWERAAARLCALEDVFDQLDIDKRTGDLL